MNVFLFYEGTMIVLAAFIMAMLIRDKKYFEAGICVFACLLGLAVEVLGVRIYRLYYYSDQFVLNISSVPVAIMVGWGLLIFSLRRLANQLTTVWWSLPIVAGLLGVTMDLFLDPMLANAVRGNFGPEVTFDSTFTLRSVSEQCMDAIPGEGIGAGFWIWCLPAVPALRSEEIMGIPSANFLSWFVIIAGYLYWLKFFTLDYVEEELDLETLSFGTQAWILVKTLVVSLVSIFVILLFFRYLFFNYQISGFTILGVLTLAGALTLLSGGRDRRSERFQWPALLLIGFNTMHCWLAYNQGLFTGSAQEFQMLVVINASAILFAAWLAIDLKSLDVQCYQRLSNEQVIRAKSETDPLTDRLVEEIFESGTIEAANRALRDLVNQSGETPQDPLNVRLHGMAQDLSEVAAGFDQQRIKNGQALFQRQVGIVVSALTVASLPEAYAMEESGRILGRTQRLAGERAFKRVAETAQFVLRVMTPGGLEPINPNNGLGVGTAAAVRIRMMHSAIRWLIRQSTPEQLAEDDPAYEGLDYAGEPINQAELLFTQQCFCWVTLRAMLQCYQDVDEDEADDYVYLWNCVGQLMGLDPKLMPQTIHEAKGTFEQLKSMGLGESEDGKKLTQAALGVMTKMLDRKLFLADYVDQLLPRVFMHQFVDVKTQKVLGVKPLNLIHRILRVPLNGFFRIVSIVDRTTQTGVFDNFKATIGFRLLQYYADHPNEVGVDTFDLPQELRPRINR